MAERTVDWLEVNKMKKKYMRPTVLIEQFTLAAHIANCGAGGNHDNALGTPTHGSINNCGWKVPTGLVIFTQKGACQELVGEGEYGDYCYNNPNPSYKVFSS